MHEASIKMIRVIMILTDFFGQNAVASESDYWSLYAPCLFHYFLISFDNSKQLVGEHSKKLFINILTILTVQCGLMMHVIRLLIVNQLC